MCSRLCSLYWCGQVAVWQLRAFVYNNDSHLLTSDHNHTSSPGREALCICVIMSSSHNDLSSSSSSTHASCFYKCVFRELAAMVFKVISYKVSTHASRHTQHMGHIHVLACSKSFKLNNSVSTTQETSGAGAQPPFLSCRRRNWIKSKWNHRIERKMPPNKEPHCVSSNKKIESHRMGRVKLREKERSLSWCERPKHLG